MSESAMHCLVSGRVQGVSFRAETRRVGDDLGLRGYVRNLSDGRVEVYACGPIERLTALRRWLAQGPEFAHVDQVECADTTFQSVKGFVIRY